MKRFPTSYSLCERRETKKLGARLLAGALDILESPEDAFTVVVPSWFGHGTRGPSAARSWRTLIGRRGHRDGPLEATVLVTLLNARCNCHLRIERKLTHLQGRALHLALIAWVASSFHRERLVVGGDR